MKIIRFLILLMLIISFQQKVAYSCTFQRFTEDSLIQCPSNTYKTLSKIGLKPTIPLECRKKNYNRYVDENIKFIDVYYDKSKHCGNLLNRTFLLSKDGTLQYAPINPSFDSDARSYAADQLKAPLLGTWSNMGLLEFSKHEIKKLDTEYCFLYHLEFPYEGTIYQCPSKENKKEYIVYGDINYTEGAFRWVNAYNLASEECFKYYSSKCNPPTMGEGKDKFYKYFGSPYANTAVKLNEDKDEVQYYLIGMPIYINQTQYNQDNKTISGGNEGMILIKIKKNGEVQSKEIERRSYKTKELFELENALLN